MNGYEKLAIAALLPVLAAAILYLLDKHTKFKEINSRAKQIICGVIFGALAIVGTEWGIPLNGAQVNCRDAAVLIAGLMFGAPAGIIAGIIGGVERWIAVAWGVGTLTRVACSVSTVIAGFYAAALRKYMFEDKKPGWTIAFAIGVVMEVFHLTMVFITNMSNPELAMAVVKACTIPMIVANGASVLCAAVVITLLGRKSGRNDGNKRIRISQIIQRWLLLTVALAFAVTSFFVFELQDTIANNQTDSLLRLALDETAADIEDASKEHILSITHDIADQMSVKDLKTLADEYNVAEVSLFDSNGLVVDSSVDSNIGLVATDYEASSEFMCLLEGETEYVQGYRANATDDSLTRKYTGVSTENGFLQVGYDAEQFQEIIQSDIVDITKNRHVGETGYVLIIDNQGELISAPESITIESLSENEASMEKISGGETLQITVNGEEIYCCSSTAEQYTIISVLPAEEALQTRDVAVYVNSFLEILVFAVLFAMIYMLIKRTVVNKIEDINSSLAKITDGDLNEVVNVRTNEEFASLSDDINATVDTLKHYIAEASARIDAELECAKDIQASVLPNVFPAFPKRKDFDIYASMNPAKEVGGDFYDFYMTGEDKINLLIADVSGKGIPAAMFMMRAKTELKRLTEGSNTLNDVFALGDNALCEGNDAGMFVTAWQCGIDLTTGVLRYVNAGHNPPLIRHKDGKFEYLRTKPGFVLAGMEGVHYKVNEVQLYPGDIIFLYTDGVTEATNADTELFGESRLYDAINSVEFESAQQLCKFIKSEVDTFVGEAPQFDDITMLAFKYNGQPEIPQISFEKASLSDIPVVTEFIEQELEKLDFPMKSTIQISVAIDEIFSNIVRYAYPGEGGPVAVKFISKEEPNRVYIRFEDEGIPYNPLTNQDPDVTLSAEERSIGGLGIFMVKKTMDSVKYKYENGKNILTIKKEY